MKDQKILALFIVALFVTSGCIGTNDTAIDEPQVELPEDWSSITKRSISSPALKDFTDCDELESELKSSIYEDYRTQLLQAVEEQYYYGGWMVDDVVMDDGAVAESSSTAGGSNQIQPRREQGTDFSGTNNQEQGVDEADFVKTDGYYIYFLNGDTLVILGVPEFGELEALSSTLIEGTPQAMMLDGNRLVVISTVSSWNIPSTNSLYQAMGWDEGYNSWRTSSLTKFSVFDITDRANPDLERELFLEGSYITAREVNGTIRTVSHAWIDIPQMKSWLELPEGYWDLDYDDPNRRVIREKVAYLTMLENSEALDRITIGDIIPRVYERINGAVIIHGLSNGDCNDFVAPEDGLNRGFNSIFTFDLSADRFDFDADHIVGNYPMVYASQDQLILTENAWDWWWYWGGNQENQEATNIHTFDISNPEETVYTGSGRVAGTILDQFSISEYQGVVRVATTEGQWARWWMEDPEPMTSSLVTMTIQINSTTGEQSLEQIGKVGGIAPEERIWSARFDGDRAYLVTFRQIDPLWVIDLSDQSNPVILGELEVPGVSTYIHPLSKDALLTIGMGPAGEDGLGLDWSSTQLSMFDISDPTTPTLSNVLSLSPINDDSDQWVWSYSEASYEHKAFQYWAPKDMLAIPLSTYRYLSWYDSSGDYHWEYDYVSKLMLVNIPQNGTNMTVHGEVNHSSFYQSEESNYWWNNFNIRRSIFMGDYVYAISSGGVTATNLTSMEQSASVQLDYQSPYNHYYNEDVAVSDSETDSSDKTDSEGSSTSSDGGAESEEN